MPERLGMREGKSADRAKERIASSISFLYNNEVSKKRHIGAGFRYRNRMKKKDGGSPRLPLKNGQAIL